MYQASICKEILVEKLDEVIHSVQILLLWMAAIMYDFRKLYKQSRKVMSQQPCKKAPVYFGRARKNNML